MQAMLEVLPILAAPALVVAATLVARRWDERAGGVVSAFPAIVGPTFVILAEAHGAAFAARAATGTLLGLVALAAFAVAYGRAATRWAWPASLAAGWLAAAATGTLLAGADASVPVATAAAAASLAVAYLGLDRVRGRASAPARRVPPPRWDLPFRMGTTAALVVTLPLAAARLGPVAGGLLAALPVLASVLTVFTHAQGGAGAAVAVLRGMAAGMGGFVAFCALVAALVATAGAVTAFALATAAAVAAQALVVRAPRRLGRRPGAGAPATRARPRPASRIQPARDR